MTLQVKAIIGVIILLIIGGLSWFSYHMVHVWADQKVVTGEQSTVIKDQSKTIQLGASSAAITDAATAGAAAQAQGVQDKQSTIDASTDAQIKAITQQYSGKTMPQTQVTFTPSTQPATTPAKPAPTPVVVPATTPSQPTPYEQAVSQVRITGVWQTYCAGNPTDPDCQGVPAPQAQQ